MGTSQNISFSFSSDLIFFKILCRYFYESFTLLEKIVIFLFFFILRERRHIGEGVAMF